MTFSLKQPVSEDVFIHRRSRVRYCVRVRWAVIGGRMEPVELQIGTVQPLQEPVAASTAKKREKLPAHWEAEQPLMLADLRDAGLQELFDRERKNGAKPYLDYIAEHGGLPQLPGPGPHEPGDVEGWTPAAIKAHYAQPFTESRRSGPDVTPAEYRLVAEVYQQAYAKGENPRAAVAKHFNISNDAAAKRVQRARQRGYLPKTDRGQPRAVPTVKRTRGKR